MAPEVFIMGEGIHFTVDDSVRLMAQLNHTNIIAIELGMSGFHFRGGGGVNRAPKNFGVREKGSIDRHH